MKLGVNIDHVATLRQARYRDDPAAWNAEPDPTHAAVEALLGGADGITLHLREDRRHVQDRDLAVAREVVRTKLNLEMALSPPIVRIALKIRPDQVTLVPERRREVTTEGGLDVRREAPRIREALRKFRAQGIPASLFVDPDPEVVRSSADLGAGAVELHTGAYALARGASVARELDRLAAAADAGRAAGLAVFAGHGLNYANAPAVARIAGIEEANIGHAIVARALFVGIRRAVREMKRLLGGGA